ncbi:hypothetical protein C1D09_007425 [Mesorhizobium intechi]|uniref:hypothetical protein n=1 Tax=Mesorhizobium intechi TaxID=537601 RepID=UPI000CB9E610|nr:hypothetical protein [Mesorhizobium intechi]TSE12711.1 hypothetical protein C1D09_007425 [Mesorhizobium intechi]
MQTHRLGRQLEELIREIERLVNAIAKATASRTGTAIKTLHEAHKCILAELDQVPAATGVIALHPAVLEEQLNQLQTGLAKGTASGDSKSAEVMRDLVEAVTVFLDPSRTGGVEAEIAGRLTALLDPVVAQRQPAAPSGEADFDPSDRGGAVDEGGALHIAAE